MRYRSTRGQINDRTFEEALFTGYASDGGILFPDSIPVVEHKTLKKWTGLTYPEIAKEIVAMFVPEEEIPKRTLNELLDTAFRTFSNPEIAPIKSLNGGLNIMELFYGKTWAFKDLALSCVGQFLNYFCSKRKKHHTIVVGTSGDTGSAAIEAVRGLKWVDIVVLLPRGRCSHTQELQMTTVLEDNIHVYRVDGSSDDLDHPIKRCFVDADFCRKHNLMSINSINWARVMVQTVHYFYAYLQMCPTCDGEVEIVIPTGACGNVTAGCLAKKMGLPVKFVCAVTRNDIVARTIRDGDFSVSSEVTPTLASAMDIQIPYNMERIWYIFSNGDTNLINKLMTEFEKSGSITVPEDLKLEIQQAIVGSHVVSDDEVKAAMRRCWQENAYYICPHTATAADHHYKTTDRHSSSENVMRVCIATASVAKFQEAVKAAGLAVPISQEAVALETKPTRYKDMEKGEDWDKILRDKIEEIDEKCGWK